MMKSLLLVLFAGLPLWSQSAAFRPPAVPLVTHDPYFSVWSMADTLTRETTRHWTGTAQSMTALVRIDGQVRRVMAGEPRQFQALRQKSVEVLPTRTVYTFEGEGIRLTFTFLTPALPHDLDALSRPLTYLVWDAQSTDGRPHRVSLYFDAGYELAVNRPDQRVTWGRVKLGEIAALRLGSQQQEMLGRPGDDLRIDWGWLYAAAPPGPGVSQAATDRTPAVKAFQQLGTLPDSDDTSAHVPGRYRNPVLAHAFDFGSVGSAAVRRWAVLAYDDIFSLEYLHRRLRPYWRRNGAEASDLLREALRDFASLESKCVAFDKEVMADLTRAGGEKYARLCALAYRQTLAAHKIAADLDGTPLMFSKENNSNGCIGTVDVIYPASPFFLLFNPRLLRAQLQPVFEYAGSPLWKHPFAPHDLGTYPLANGQVYRGGTEQMPVEESGNMLIMMAALARVEGNADFALRYWPLLARWAGYLKEKGLDPEDQLSTDDFAGHLAHNSNLSLKAILALASYGSLCDMAGKREEAAVYRGTAAGFARKWIAMADDGDHYRLAFDKPGTWSQKYNLVWDRLLGLKMFPPEVARKELAYYRERQNPYGLPLDNRERYTKLDWIAWTASLAESRADFETLFAPAYRFAHESPSRVPLTDWYWTHDGARRGFQARSVVGGLFIQMLNDPALWKKWAAR